MVPCRPRSEVQPLTARSGDDGLATRYIGVADPSEPNYVAMLGGSTFGISSDDPTSFLARRPTRQTCHPRFRWRQDLEGLLPGHCPNTPTGLRNLHACLAVAGRSM